MPKIILPGHIGKILARLEGRGFEAWCVGGCVRDALLTREPSDWDIATAALPRETIACFPELKALETGIVHGTVALMTEGGPVEVTTYRVDGEYTGHRRPLDVSFSRDVREDLARRDFTVNAMAWHPARGLLDPFGGREDLRARLLRCVGDPSRRFDEDALRILRCARFSAVLGFRIEEGTLSAALSSLGLIGGLSGERVRDELTKLLCAPGAGGVLGLYPEIILAALPELSHLPEVSEAPPSPLPRWAALLRDCSDGAARGLLTRLRFPSREISEIARAVRQLPLAPKDEPLAKRLERAGMTVSGLKISGRDLLGLGYSPGPGVGAALESLLRGVISGELINEPGALLEHAGKIM